MTATLDSLLTGTTSSGVFVWRGAGAPDFEATVSDAGWQILPMDTSHTVDAASVYDVISEGWELPPWFGRNLDALWDVLADRASEPAMVVWDAPEALVAADPDFAVVLLGLLRDAATQAERLAVVLRPAAGGSQEPIFSELDGLL